MLNELMLVEEGARIAGIEIPKRHPDVKDVRQIPTLSIQLDKYGDVALVGVVPRGIKPWTLRDGQHNSFPFVQPKDPLLIVPEKDNDRYKALQKKRDGQREAVIDLFNTAQFRSESFENWPGKKMLARLRERRKQFDILKNTNAAVIFDTFDRFLVAFETQTGGSERLLKSAIHLLKKNIEKSAMDSWIEIAIALLIGKFDKKKNKWTCNGAFLFEAFGAPLSIIDQKLIAPMSKALEQTKTSEMHDRERSVCALTGVPAKLLSGNFPQPNLNVLGQTWLFAKNKEIPANDRYGRFASAAIPVGQDMTIRLAGALTALTSDDRKNKTWRPIPGETPKQYDLLLAFVEENLDAFVAESLAEDDYSEEESTEVSHTADSIATFEMRTKRLIESVRAKLTADFKKTPVRLIIFRKVDRANRKVIYSSSLSVAELYEAAARWTLGERNSPPWLRLPVLIKGAARLRLVSPPHIAPLGLISFTKRIYFRKGVEGEITGLPASEILRFFLYIPGIKNFSGQRCVERILRVVISRRTPLITSTAQCLTTRGWFCEGVRP